MIALGSYPVVLEARGPLRFERIQVVFRLVLLAVLGIFHQTIGGIFCTLYLILPVAAALAIGRKGGTGFRDGDARVFVAVLDWVIAFYAYVLFVTDRFPLLASERASRVVVEPSGSPSVGAALARLLTSLPHAIVLAVLGIASAFVALGCAFSILFTEHCPETLRSFQRDVVAWMARVFAYHASLVEPYPPFALGIDDGARHAHP